MLSLFIGFLAIVGNSFGAKPIPQIKQEETKVVIPPTLEEVEEAILPSQTDSTLKSSGIEADSLMEESKTCVSQKIIKGLGSNPDEPEVKNPPKVKRQNEKKPNK